MRHKPGVTMHNCDLSTCEKEAEGLQFKVILGYIHTQFELNLAKPSGKEEEQEGDTDTYLYLIG